MRTTFDLHANDGALAVLMKRVEEQEALPDDTIEVHTLLDATLARGLSEAQVIMALTGGIDTVSGKARVLYLHQYLKFPLAEELKPLYAAVVKRQEFVRRRPLVGDVTAHRRFIRRCSQVTTASGDEFL